MVWKLLRQHISLPQLAGFFFANLCGMVIVLLSVQFYKDILPVFTEGDSFIKKDYIIVSKKVSTLGAFVGKSNTFSDKDIADIKAQSFTKEVGAFTPSQFKVSAGMGMEKVGLQMSTDMFFESVPDGFVDVNLDKWVFNENEPVIPIIIPRNYLNLYNFGFAQSRSLPQLSEGVMGMVNLDIRISGDGRREVRQEVHRQRWKLCICGKAFLLLSCQGRRCSYKPVREFVRTERKRWLFGQGRRLQCGTCHAVP